MIMKFVFQNLNLRCHQAFVCLAVLTSILMSGATANAQWIKDKLLLQGPFVDSDPFDLIYLTDQGENAILKVLPLTKDYSGGLPDQGSLQFDFFEGGEETLEVPFSSVESIKTFNDLLLEEANAWLEEKEYTLAFRNYLHVYDHGGRSDQKLVAALRTCLFQDGKTNFQNGNFEMALSIYEDIYTRSPDFKVEGMNGRSLADIVMACYDGIIQKQYDEEDYRGVRYSLETIVSKYGEESKALNKKWSSAFKKKSDNLLAKSRELARKGLGRESHLAAKQADQMSPGRPEVLEYQKALLRQFPLVIVGVSQNGADANPVRLEHWGSRRVGRLTQRMMVELTGLTDEGGKYEFLNGSLFSADEFGRSYTFEIKDDISTFGVPPTDAYQVASRLLSLADPESDNYSIAWQKVVGPISIEGEKTVHFELRTPFIRPEALLKLAYAELDSEKQPDQNGKYVMTADEDDAKIFELNPMYEPVEGRQHPVVVEQLFPTASDAVDQLIAGNIDVVDRVPPSDIKKLKSAKKIEVRSYLLPTVHMLIPKIRGALEKDMNFRSGLSHAIDRELLVQDVLCGGQEISGCETISGPFPIGTEENDQISYGYDLKVRPLAFNSQLGMVLINLALRPRPPVRPEAIPMPKLVIAYPDSSFAAEAAQAIAGGWNEIGVTTSTRRLKPGETYPPDEDWDFLYFESVSEEPLADAMKIIGPHGFAKKVSAPVDQTLRNLSYSDTWQGTCSSLRRLHRQVAVDLSVLPLWQLKEHYAYRTTVREIGRDLIHLYQHVDRWKVDLTEEEGK
jgi:tetratricopeptide (TPR) repeat protein